MFAGDAMFAVAFNTRGGAPVSLRRLLLSLLGAGCCQILVMMPVHAESGNISVIEAHNRATKGELVLVDIRAPKEWQASGLPASSKAITMYQERFAICEGFEKCCRW